MTKLRYAIFVVVVYMLSCGEGKNSAIPAKRFRLDLDIEPMQRWDSILENFNKSQVLDVIDTLLKEFVNNKELIALAKLVAADLDRYLPQPYADEIRGISKFYGVKLGDIVLGNLAYDVSAWDTKRLKACTSIVTIDKNGGIIHGRNLDYPAGDSLRQITAEIEFHRSGKTIFVGTTYIGYVGILTAAKPEAFSLSGDQRNTGFFWQNLLSALEGAWPTMLLSREVMMNATNYDEAVEMLSKAKTISPMYFIVGGLKPHEGAIVVRGRQGAVNITKMTDTSHSWFSVETNYEPWKSPPSSDDRRDAAIKYMTNIGQNEMDADNLYKVLSTPPVFAPDTTYTTIMSARNISMYGTMLRYDHPTTEK